MGFFSRLFGISKTATPRDYGCWRFLGRKIEVDLSRAPELSREHGAMRIEAPGLPVRALVLRDREGNIRPLRAVEQGSTLSIFLSE